TATCHVPKTSDWLLESRFGVTSVLPTKQGTENSIAEEEQGRPQPRGHPLAIGPLMRLRTLEDQRGCMIRMTPCEASRRHAAAGCPHDRSPVNRQVIQDFDSQIYAEFHRRLE